MAQTVDQIKSAMLTEKANHDELSGLTSDSNTSVYGLWMFVTATIIVFFEQLMDTFMAQIQGIINNNQYGTDGWWYRQIMAFQFGNALEFINNVYQYPNVDSAAQIIGFCSISSLNGIVQIKVAANSGGSPVKLTTPQYEGVVAYCQQIQPAGIQWAVLSQDADTLKIYGNVYFDATQDITVIKPAVYAAITAFLNGLNTVQTVGGAPVTQNFNGTLYVNKLIDAIRSVPGLIGNQFDLTSISAAAFGGGYTSFTSSNQPEAGYFTIDPAFPLADTLTFIPYNAG